LRLSDVRHIFVTHSHSDHFCPAELELRRPPFAHFTERPKMKLYGNETVIAMCGDVYDTHLAPYLELVTVHAGDTVRVDDDTTVTALPALHKFDEETLVFYIERNGKAVLYGHDSGIYPQAAWDALRGKRLDLVLFDCTFGPGQDGGNHMGIVDNVIVRGRMMAEGIADEATRFVITHFSHNAHVSHDFVAAAGAAHGLDCAYDGAVYTL